MRLSFLGTGAAFSLERYNGAVVVDGRLLLDAGAPLLPHMHRLGIDPSGIEVLFLTHFHGDHVLGLPTFMLYRAYRPLRPLTVLGPPGVERRLEQLFELAWGDTWPEYRRRIDLTYVEAAGSGEVAGVRYETVKLDHGDVDCRGYRIHLGSRILAYAGDTAATPPLDALVSGVDVAITEATGPSPTGVHTSWEEAQALVARHPGTRFLFNHVFSGTISGAVDDLAVIDA